MIEQSMLLKLTSPELAENIASRLRQEYQAFGILFNAQSTLTQQYLVTQAATLAEAIVSGDRVAHFSLPDQVVYPGLTAGVLESGRIPEEQRAQIAGSQLDRISRTSIRAALVDKFSKLEGSLNTAISTSTGLLRYLVARHMVYNLLPAGKSVKYRSVNGDDIPNQPVEQEYNSKSVSSSQADTDSFQNQTNLEVREQFMPYVETAGRFYLPQWIAFDVQGNLLQAAVSEAEAYIASMHHYLAILDTAIVIAPYMIADEVWQQKRYGMLGQLVNQGRALANYQSREIIQTVKRRAAEHKLDRGLRVSLPYFNDQKLVVEDYDFLVIPAGRIMFIPAFAVLAAREQQSIVAENLNLSLATRKHLLAELHEFEVAFIR